MSNDRKAAYKAGNQPAITKARLSHRKWRISRSSAACTRTNWNMQLQCLTQTPSAELSSAALAIIKGEQFSRGETVERAVAYYPSGHSRLADILIIRIYDHCKIENKKSCVAIQLRDLEHLIIEKITSISGQQVQTISATEFPT